MNSISIFRNYVKEHVGVFVLTSSLLVVVFFTFFKIVTNNPILAVVLSVCTIFLLFFVGWRYYLSEQLRKIKKFGEVLDIDRYQSKHRELFGDYIELGGLKLSEFAFQYPIFLWADDTKISEQIERILTKAREMNKRILIFEDGDSFYQSHAKENDILLNPFIENAYTWNIYEDFKAEDNIINYISKNTLLKCDEYLQAFKTCNFLHNSREFLAALCLSPIDDVMPILKEMKIDSSENVLIRKTLAELLSFPTSQKELAISNSNNIIWVSCFLKTDMYKLSRFILDASDKSTLKLVLQKSAKDIKASNTIVINPRFDEFYARFNGTFLAIGSTEFNQKVASLFGQTTITDIIIGNTRYHNINHPAVSEKDLAHGDSFFKFYKSHDVLRI